MTMKETFSEYVLANPIKLDYGLKSLGLSLDFDAMGGSMFVDVSEEVSIYITPYFDGSEEMYFEIHTGFSGEDVQSIEMTLEHTGDLDKDYNTYVEVVLDFIKVWRNSQFGEDVPKFYS